MARRQIVLGVRRWVLVATAITALAAGVGSAVAKWHNRPIVIVQAPPPPPPAACRDGAYVMSIGDDVQCDSRSRIEVYPAYAEHLLVKCICRR